MWKKGKYRQLSLRESKNCVSICYVEHLWQINTLFFSTQSIDPDPDPTPNLHMLENLKEKNDFYSHQCQSTLS